MQELIGQSLGQYRIVDIIGQGGMATVFKARQAGLERWVAVKVLPPHYAADAHFSAHFLREAQAIAQLEHPHILPVYDFGQQGQYIYLVMRYIEGSRTLADVMSQPLPFSQMLTYLDQVAAALDYAHEHGIVHRDIKPTNILLNRNWVFLADFGLARLTRASASLTITDVALGTPAYMSPEQARGARVDAPTDVYALGVIVYEMLVGQIPHSADSGQAVLYKRNHEPPPSLQASRPDTPVLIDQMVQTALALDPAQRFQSAGAFVKALHHAVEETKAGQWPTAAVPVRSIGRPSPSPVVAPLPLQPAPGPLPVPASAQPPASPAEVTATSGKSSCLWWAIAGVTTVVVLVLLAGMGLWLISGQPASPPNQTAQPETSEPVSSLPPVIAELFVDEFEGVGLDRANWNYALGGGQIQVFNSLLRLTSAGQTFPWVYAARNPFPAEGNFKLTVKLRYLDAAENGTGLRLDTLPVSEQVKPAAAGRIIEVWQDDAGWRIGVGEADTEVYTLAEPEIADHTLEIAYLNQVYHIFVDGQEVYASPPTSARPVTLWLGNPSPVDAGGDWSGLEVDRVAVESLADTVAAAPTATLPSVSTETPSGPTVTPTALAQNCSDSAGGPFAEIWPEYRQQLGCPTSPPQTLSTIAEEAFQGGHLFWSRDTDQVYIIFDRQKDGTELAEGEWQLTPPEWKWDGSNPDGVGLSPPSGLLEPRRGFGWLWRTHLGGAEGPLGWALDREYGFDNLGQAQTFEQGVMFKGSASRIYVLLNNGRFYVR